jgi:hypothetical protein
MGGIMSYRRLRERNGLQRTLPLDADPYSEQSALRPKSLNTYMLLGDWNRFESDILGYSCWCPRGSCLCGHGQPSHRLMILSDGPAMRLMDCLADDCACEAWDTRPPHRDGNICPANDYAAKIARRAGVETDAVRAVVRALMETQ